MRRNKDRFQYQKQAIEKFTTQLAYTQETGDELGDLGNAITILWDSGVILFPGEQWTEETEDPLRLLRYATAIAKSLASPFASRLIEMELNQAD